MKTISTFLITFALYALTTVADDSKFFGTWSTDWGLLVIKHGEEQIEGKYTGQFNGTIEGQVKEGKLHVTWKQTNGEWGSAVFTVSADGKALSGTWGGDDFRDQRRPVERETRVKTRKSPALFPPGKTSGDRRQNEA